MARKAKRVQLKDLAAATKASVQAAVGKELLQNIKPGNLAGIMLNEHQLATLGREPIDLAKEIAKSVSERTGISVTPGIQKLPEAVFVGYLVPRNGRR